MTFPESCPTKLSKTAPCYVLTVLTLITELLGQQIANLFRSKVSSDMRVDPSDDIRTDPPISRFMQVYCS